MINTLNLGKYIFNTLTNSDTIKCKVYPLVADNDAKFPFIIYKRANLNSSRCKDGTFQDDATIEIDVITDKYSVGVDIANEVRKLLEIQHTVYDGMEINDVDLIMATEEYNNAYIQRMQFNYKINN